MHRTVLYPVPTTLRIGALVEWTSIYEQYTFENSAVEHHTFQQHVMYQYQTVPHVMMLNSFTSMAS